MKLKTLALPCAALLAFAPAAFAQDDMPPATPDDPMDEPLDDPLVEPVDEAMPPSQGDDVDIDIYPPAPAEPAPAPVVVTEPAVSEEVAGTTQNVANRLGDYFGEYGIGSIKVGAGGGDFTEDSVQAQTGGGATWDVRALFGAHSPIGIEAAYVGSSRSVDGGAGDIPSGADALVSNGLEGDLRLAIPIRASEMVDVRPFAFGGLGWQYMTLWGDGAVDGAADDGDHILTVPAGVGLEFGFGPLTVDARATYRHAVGSDLFGDATAEFDDPDALHTWNVGGGIGLQF